MGCFAVPADPHGAVFAAFRFYQELFGWEKTESMEMGPAGTYQMFGGTGASMGGVYQRPADLPTPPSLWRPRGHGWKYSRIADSVRSGGRATVAEA